MIKFTINKEKTVYEGTIVKTPKRERTFLEERADLTISVPILLPEYTRIVHIENKSYRVSATVKVLRHTTMLYLKEMK